MTLDEVLTMDKEELKEAVKIAQKGTHCGMCKVDFLDSGLCPAGKKHGYAAYWPEGRMEVVKALYSNKIKPTKELVEIANSCTICGICDKQCNFITHLRPEKVSKALKEFVNKLDIQIYSIFWHPDILDFHTYASVYTYQYQYY